MEDLSVKLTALVVRSGRVSSRSIAELGKMGVLCRTENIQCIMMSCCSFCAGVVCRTLHYSHSWNSLASETGVSLGC